ncbi:sericin 1-like [Acanthaster planci]|uniref:Sericin 1-like n=1 Tax=Acanthaster planci TaxID=133434 RepID=A0A8B7Z2Y2_ACAPL|nr:sericin 1-like [Acanthaster planci]
MNSRRNLGSTVPEAYNGMAVFSGDMNNNKRHQSEQEPVRYKRGKRRKSITLTRKDMPAVRPKSPATVWPHPRPMKRSDSNISRVSVASEFATIAEDEVCNDFGGDVWQSYPQVPCRRVSFSSAPTASPSLLTNWRLSSSSLVDNSSLSSSLGKPSRRRVSIISLQRSDSTASSLLDLNARRLSTVSDAVVVRKNARSRRRGSADGYAEHYRRVSADGHSLVTGRRSFPPLQPTSRRYHRSTGPAYQSYPPPDMDNVAIQHEGEQSGDIQEGSMADTEDLSYEATLRRASLASIHEMHHAVTLLKNQKALAKLQKAARRNSRDGLKEGFSARRSSLRRSSPIQPVDSASSHARGSTASLDTHLRRLSISSSIQDMHQKMTLIKEGQMVKRLNSKVHFSVVEDAARPSSYRRGSLAGGRRRSSVAGSPASAPSIGSMPADRGRRGSEDSDSYNSFSSGDYSSSSSGSSSYYSGSSFSDSSSDTDSSLDWGTSSNSGSEVSDNSRSSHEGNYSSEDGSGPRASSADSSTETDSGNGTLSSSHGSKSEGQPKGVPELAGPSGLGWVGRTSPKTQSNIYTNTKETYFQYPDTIPQAAVRSAIDTSDKKVTRGRVQSKACVLL